MKFLSGSRRRLSLPLLRWCAEPTILVEPKELEGYRQEHPSIDIESLPKNDGGFSYLMNHMIARTLARGERYFAFTDDDVTDLRERESVEQKFRRAQSVSATLEALAAYATANDLAQLAVSFAGQSWAAKLAIQRNVGAWGVHLTDARAARAVGGYDESLVCFGDWDMSARLLAAGYHTSRTNLVTFVHRMKSHDGGASDIYRRADAVRDAACRVAAKFPDAAQVRFVPGHGLHEVRLNWRKIALRSLGKPP